MTDIYDILEICMTQIEQGAELEVVLATYPDHVAELRPILTAARSARAVSVPMPSVEVVNRNRVKLLQRAAQMREWEQFSNRGFSSFQGKWTALFIVLLLTIFGGLTAIRASEEALPGDGLYSVKRWWEGVRLAFATDDSLSGELAEERLAEVDRLFALGLAERVEFVGFVNDLTDDMARVAHIPVLITPATQLPDSPLFIGNVVRVYGVTRADGVVVAERIEFPQGEVSVPGASPFHLPSATPTAVRTEPATSVGTEAPTFTATSTPSPTSTATPVNVTGTATKAADNSNANSNGNDNADDNNNDDNDNDNDNSNDNDDDNNNN